MIRRGEHTGVGGARPYDKIGRESKGSTWTATARQVLKHATKKKRREQDRKEAAL